MPCYTRFTYATEKIKFVDLDVFKQLLAKHSWQVLDDLSTTITFRNQVTGLKGTYYKETGLIEMGSDRIGQSAMDKLTTEFAATMRKEYSEVKVKQAAKRFGWTVKNGKKANTFEITRRSF